MEAAYGSGIVAALLGVGLLAACAGPSAPAVAENPAGSPAPVIAEAPLPPPIEIPPTPEPPPEPTKPALACSGTAKQGGAILCQAIPGSTITLDDKPVAIADAGGAVVVGLSRSQASPAKVAMLPVTVSEEPKRVIEASTMVEVMPRADSVSQFEMECERIAPQSPEDKRHAEASWVRKDRAMKAFNTPLAPVGLVKPADGPYSSVFGTTRTYVPKTKDCEGSTSVHNGQDIAVPTGTEVHAPMAGTVLLADPDLFYEGGAVFLDMGRGLVSVTMHMSRIDVKDGETVAQGQLLGLSGATGRVTGPHLHWAIKYRNVLSDDRGTDIWLDPMLMLDLKPPG
jgi:biotin carboxyl carrier protein